MDEQPVGPELDALVATKVMGWTCEKFWPVSDMRHDRRKPCETWRQPDGSAQMGGGVWAFSTDIERAMRVLCKARGTSHFDIGSKADGNYYCQIQPFPGDEPIGYGVGATISEAICRAALVTPRDSI